MDFKVFASALAKIEKIPLPGHFGHKGLLPAVNHQRWAGVLCLFYPDEKGKTHFVLIRRQVSTGPHSGQVAFPGGRKDPDDYSMAETALRECEEEIGVNRHSIKLFKAMSELYIPPSDFWVKPYMGLVNYSPKFVPQKEEVAGLIFVSAAELFDDTLFFTEQIHYPQRGEMNMPVFDFQGNRVWGATAMMLFEMRQTLGEIIS
jgi:8-oxo-dGTP pyrophosphatase MutT (NUDIX family)